MDSTKRQLKKYYNDNVEDRNNSPKQQWKLKLREEFLGLMKENGCKKLLEIGAGTGQDSLYFQEKAIEVTAIDLSEKHIEKCNQKGIEAYVMDFADMTFDDGSFDCIYAMNCLLHVSNHDIIPVLSEVKRIMRKGGLFCLCQYGGKSEQGIMDKYGMGDRFFSFRLKDEFAQYAIKSGYTIALSGEIDLGEEGYNVQYFVITPKDAMTVD